MKKFALIAATLICFAGCARNDTEEMGATETTTTDTGYGTSASSQTGTESAASVDPANMDTNNTSAGASATLSADTNSVSGSSSLNLDTNNLGQPPVSQSTDNESTPPPAPPATEQP